MSALLLLHIKCVRRASVFFLCTFALTFAIEVIASDGSLIDDTELLKVGDVSVSRYQIEKNLLSSELASSVSGQPCSHQLEQWIQSYLKKCAVVHHALRQGVDKWPEVINLVSSMERHVLTGPRGLYLLARLSQWDASSVGGRGIVYDPSYRFDFNVLYYEKGKTAEGEIEADIRILERMNSQVRNQEFAGELLWDGEVSIAFQELGELALSSLDIDWAPGTFERIDCGSKVALVFCRNVRERNPWEGDSVNDEVLYQLRVLDMHRVIRSEAYLSSVPRLNEEALDLFAELLRGAALGEEKIPAGLATDCGSVVLLEYLSEGVRCTLGVEGFVEWHNKRLTRRAPRDRNDLRDALHEFIVEDYMLQASRSMGIDTTMRFLQDRENFLRNQVYDVYLRKVASELDPADLETLMAFYEDSREEFYGPIYLEGDLFLIEADLGDNEGDLRFIVVGEGEVVPGTKDTVRGYRLDRSKTLANGQSVFEVVLSSPASMAWGPIETNYGKAYFRRYAEAHYGFRDFEESMESVRFMHRTRTAEMLLNNLAIEVLTEIEVVDQIDRRSLVNFLESRPLLSQSENN